MSLKGSGPGASSRQPARDDVDVVDRTVCDPGHQVDDVALTERRRLPVHLKERGGRRPGQLLIAAGERIGAKQRVQQRSRLKDCW